MFKRRDWVYTHNPDTGDVTSESDSDGNDDSVSSEINSELESQDEDEVGLSALPEDEQTEVPHIRMEDLQEMLDSDSEEADVDDETDAVDADIHRGKPDVQGKAARDVDPVSVEEQKAAWLQAPKEINVKGIPLRCLLCKNKLLVNSSGFQGHLKSKAHLAAAKRHGVLDNPIVQLDSIVAAASHRHKVEESETHRERVERFRQIAEGLKTKKQAEAMRQTQSPRKRHRKCPQEEKDLGIVRKEGESHAVDPMQKKKPGRSGQNSSGRPRRKKPGKRQRMEAKAAAAAASAAAS